jgi:Tfp pilus assembly protein PilV
MPKKIPGDKNFSQSIPALTCKKNGFILLEVLVAMSLVAISWIGLGNTYQLLVLRLGQEQYKRLQIHQELDQHELQQSQLLINESTRVSRRNRYIPNTSRPTDQK